MDDAAEAGPEGDDVMTWMRTVMADPRWRSMEGYGGGLCPAVGHKGLLK